MDTKLTLKDWALFFIKEELPPELADDQISVKTKNANGTIVTLTIKEMRSGSLRAHFSGLRTSTVGWGKFVPDVVKEFLVHRLLTAA
jgi:hypothetical protein